MSYIQKKETFAIYLTDGMLYDKLHRFAAEYSLPVEVLVNLAVKRLEDDIKLLRGLRSGKTGDVNYSTSLSK